MKRAVSLRKFFLKDTKNLQQMFVNEKDLTDVGVNVKHDKITLKFTRNWLARNIKIYKKKKPTSILYAVVNEKKEHMGNIGIGNINYKDKSAEIGYWISNKYSNKGYGTLAIKSFVDNIPKLFNLKKILAETSKKNISSQSILKKNGFKIKKKLKNKLLYEFIQTNITH